jgi:hypothetical protein
LLHVSYSKLVSNYVLATQRRVDKYIRKIYNYDAFSKKQNNGNWCAYALCARLGTTTCPYCNLAYGHTLIVGGDGKIRPELDHFFDKATYPLFAISLNNFVPSCHFCNSSLKHSADFHTLLHLNPLFDRECIEVGLDVNPLLARNNVDLFAIASINLSYDVTNAKAVNSISTFHLKERYELLVDEAREIAKFITKFRTQQGPIKGSLEWAMRGVDLSNYKNRILGKMIIDLAKLYL